MNSGWWPVWHNGRDAEKLAENSLARANKFLWMPPNDRLNLTLEKLIGLSWDSVFRILKSLVRLWWNNQVNFILSEDLLNDKRVLKGLTLSELTGANQRDIKRIMEVINK